MKKQLRKGLKNVIRQIGSFIKVCDVRDEKRRLEMEEKEMKKRSLDYIVNKIASYFEIILKITINI